MSRFGGGSDLYICDDCNIKTNSTSHLGHSYEAPDGSEYNSNEAKNYLAGSQYFTV